MKNAYAKKCKKKKVVVWLNSTNNQKSWGLLLTGLWIYICYLTCNYSICTLDLLSVPQGPECLSGLFYIIFAYMTETHIATLVKLLWSWQVSMMDTMLSIYWPLDITTNLAVESRVVMARTSHLNFKIRH